MTEIEAKFIIPDAETFDSLLSLSRLGNFALEPGVIKQVSDQYLDTPDGRFMAAGFALRIRQSGKSKVATLKSLTPASGGIHRREELETEIATDNPHNWPDSAAKSMALKILGDATLKVLFVISQKRHKFVTTLGGKRVIEFSLDVVRLTPDEPIKYRELEAELLEAGTEQDLKAFVEALLAQWPLQEETRSKFERGWDSIGRVQTG